MRAVSIWCASQLGQTRDSQQSASRREQRGRFASRKISQTAQGGTRAAVSAACFGSRCSIGIRRNPPWRSALHGMAGNRPGRNVGIGIAEATAARAVPPCARKRPDRKPQCLARKRRRARRRLESAGRRWKCLARKQGSLARKPDCLAFHPAGRPGPPAPRSQRCSPRSQAGKPCAQVRAPCDRPGMHRAPAGFALRASLPRPGTALFASRASRNRSRASLKPLRASSTPLRARPAGVPGPVEDVSRQARSIRNPDCAPLASTMPPTCTSARIPSHPRRRARVTRGYARLDRCRKRWLITHCSTARWSTAR